VIADLLTIRIPFLIDAPLLCHLMLGVSMSARLHRIPVMLTCTK
jgi:hypothetical protein